MGRTTQGVTLMNVEEGEKLAGLSRIAEPEEENVAEQDLAAGVQDSEDVSEA